MEVLDVTSLRLSYKNEILQVLDPHQRVNICFQQAYNKTSRFKEIFQSGAFTTISHKLRSPTIA